MHNLFRRGISSLAIALVVTAALAVAPQVSHPGSVSAQTATPTTLTACGAFGGATGAGTAAASIKIGATTYSLAPTTTLPAPLPAMGTNVCITATLNPAGQITALTITPTTAPGTTVSICGTLTSYSAATATTAGSISIGGSATYPIPAGTILNNAALLTPNSSVCLTATLNPAGAISTGTVTSGTTAAGAITVEICGPVTAYTAATNTTAGTIGIAGLTLTIAAGTAVTGTGTPAAGQNLCVLAAVAPSGNIVNLVTAPALATGSTITGPSVSTTGTTVTINGTTFPVVAGTRLVVTNGTPLAASIMGGTSGSRFTGLR